MVLSAKLIRGRGLFAELTGVHCEVSSRNFDSQNFRWTAGWAPILLTESKCQSVAWQVDPLTARPQQQHGWLEVGPHLKTDQAKPPSDKACCRLPKVQLDARPVGITIIDFQVRSVAGWMQHLASTRVSGPWPQNTMCHIYI